MTWQIRTRIPSRGSPAGSSLAPPLAAPWRCGHNALVGTDGQDSHDAKGEQEHFFGAAKLVAALTMLSRVLGLVRDMVLVPMGGPIVADAFWTAFGIPHLFRRLFGEGALSAAFIPVFTEAGETAGWDRARRVLANTAGVLAVVLTGLVVTIEIGLAVWLLAAPGESKRQLTLQFTMLMLPFTFFICMLALASAALNSKRHFAYPAAAPILLNVGLIVFGYWLAPVLGRNDVEQLRIIGIGVVLCSVGQFLGAVWLLRRTQLAARWTLRPILPEVKQIARRMAPTVVPLGLVQLSDLFARLIALACTAGAGSPHLPLKPGVIRCHYAAGRLYQLPLGVLAISIATAVFPLFSRYAARDDKLRLRGAINRALRLCLFLGIPAGAGLFVLAEPTIGQIFERGGFSPLQDTPRTAVMLQMYCLGLPAYFCVHILLRAFFARKDTRTPMITAAILAVLNVLLVLGGIFTPLRSAALGLATAVTGTVNAFVLAWVLHRQVGRLGGRKLLASAARVMAAATVMAAAVLGSREALDWLGCGRLVIILAGVVVGALAFAGAAWGFRCPELGELRRRPASQRDGDSDTMA